MRRQADLGGQELEARVSTAVRRLEPPEVGQVCLVGDLHGQLEDLAAAVARAGLPHRSTAPLYLLFNGDLVDRGPHSCEVLFVVLAALLAWPDRILVNRGNHESRAMAAKYSFEREVLRKYDDRLYDAIQVPSSPRGCARVDTGALTERQELFDRLPLATLIVGGRGAGRRVLVLHGGLFSSRTAGLAELERVQHRREVPLGSAVEEDRLFVEALWSDPQREPGIAPSHRGAGILFGPDETAAFMAREALDLLVRSHELVELGYEFLHGDALLTLFSASNYCGKQRNHGAIAQIPLQELAPPRLPQMRQPLAVRFLTWQTELASTLAAGKLKEDALQQLREVIFVHKPQLLAWYRERASHFISTAQWAEGLRAVLGGGLERLPWEHLLPHLASPEPNGELDYRAGFLDRYQLLLPAATESSSSSSSSSSLSSHRRPPAADSLAQRICAKLYDSIDSLAGAFRHLDRDESGSLTLAELSAALGSMQLGLSEAEIARLFEVLDQDRNGRVTFNEFRAHFEPIYGSVAEARRRERGMHEALAKLAARLKLQSRAQLRQLFEQADQNRSGRLSYKVPAPPPLLWSPSRLPPSGGRLRRRLILMSCPGILANGEAAWTALPPRAAAGAREAGGRERRWAHRPERVREGVRTARCLRSVEARGGRADVDGPVRAPLRAGPPVPPAGRGRLGHAAVRGVPASPAAIEPALPLPALRAAGPRALRSLRHRRLRHHRPGTLSSASIPCPSFFLSSSAMLQLINSPLFQYEFSAFFRKLRVVDVLAS